MAVIIRDEFTDADGTLLTAHAISPTNVPGASWVTWAPWPSIVIGSNKATNAAANEIRRNLVNSGVSDCVITTAGYTGVGTYRDELIWIFRWVDTNNYWRVDIGQEGGATRNLVLFEVTGGVVTPRATAALAYAPSTLHTMTIALSGTSIAVSVVGATSASVSYTSASHQAATIHGLYLSQVFDARAAASFDNYQIEAGNAVPVIMDYYRRRRAR